MKYLIANGTIGAEAVIIMVLIAAAFNLLAWYANKKTR